MSYTVEGTGEKPRLNNSNFKTKGGEGSIYVVGSTVYKICEPGKMIPEQKLRELRVLDHPKIIKPENRILDANSQPVGYTMRLVPGDAEPLARILTKQYREREGITPEVMMELVRQLVEGTRFVHSHKGYLLVDANEFNFMVSTDNHDAIYFIDTNSYQTPHFPATAIMQSIRDPLIKQNSSGHWMWTKESDWYSIAILTWYMFTGIHPFKGDHPKYTNIKTFWQDQMRDNISVMRPDVTVPINAVYHPFETVIPGGTSGAYWQWYKSILLENKRLPAPLDFQSAITFVATIKEIAGSHLFDIAKLFSMPTKIVGYYARSGKEVVVTKDHIINGGIKWRRPNCRFRCGFAPITNTPFSCEFLDTGNVRLTNLNDGEDIPIVLSGRDIMSTNGRVYVLGNDKIFEITFKEKTSYFVASATQVASVRSNATTLYQGCAIQNAFGKYQISIFPDTKMHYQFEVEELNDYQITDAKFEGGVLMVVGLNSKGGYDRFVIRVQDGHTEVFRKIENINPVGLNFTVSEGGICVCINETEKVEIFSCKLGQAKVEFLDDPSVTSDMKLCHHGMKVQFAHGDGVYSISKRKST